mmetsp:Transcript_14920/g.45172  ORF Transcript_14920/g.45172 Transcript_14920/m.45172 type:complete len:260 (+) Transcript_14920:228-1007(+)
METKRWCLPRYLANNGLRGDEIAAARTEMLGVLEGVDAEGDEAASPNAAEAGEADAGPPRKKAGVLLDPRDNDVLALRALRRHRVRTEHRMRLRRGHRLRMLHGLRDRLHRLRTLNYCHRRRHGLDRRRDRRRRCARRRGHGRCGRRNLGELNVERLSGLGGARHFHDHDLLCLRIFDVHLGSRRNALGHGDAHHALHLLTPVRLGEHDGGGCVSFFSTRPLNPDSFLHRAGTSQRKEKPAPKTATTKAAPREPSPRPF